MSLLHQSVEWGAELSFAERPGAEEVAERLRRAGCGDKRVAVRKDDEGGWRIVFAHPHWGKGAARLVPSREPIPAELMMLQPGVLESDAAARSRATCSVDIRGPGSNAHVLRDRKGMLWFARAILGDEGIDAMDLNTGRFWTKDMLDDELCHDGDADVSAIYMIHAVGDDERSIWAHTHGLQSIGGPDVDLLRASPETIEQLEAVVYMVLDGAIVAEEPSLLQIGPSDFVFSVPLEMYCAVARRQDLQLRHDDEYHAGPRVVLCDPPGRLARILRRKARPSSVFTGRRMVDMMPYSEQSSDIMADRAKASLPLLRRYREEFARHEPITGVKIGMPTDDGEGREHLWFEVDDLGKDKVRAKLVVQPFEVSSMTPGETYELDLASLSGWILQTPAGPISPSTTIAARLLRAGKVG